jgi:hypothetical protein
MGARVRTVGRVVAGLLGLGLVAALILGCRSAERRGVLRVSDEEVYIKRCASCHRAYPGSHFTVERWRAFLPKHPTVRQLRPPPEDAEVIAQYLGL